MFRYPTGGDQAIDAAHLWLDDGAVLSSADK